MYDKEKFYDKKFYGDSVNKRHIKALNELKQLNKAFKNILDVGCGAGYPLSYIKTNLNIKDAFGLDISNDTLKDINTLGIKGFQVDLDNDPFPFEDNYFDVIISVEVIEHLNNPDLYLNEIYRVLKSSGVFVITTPNLGWWINILGLLLGYQPNYTDTSLNTSLGHFNGKFEPHGHLRNYSINGLSELLKLHQFKLLKKFGIQNIGITNYIEFIDNQISNHFPRFSCHIGFILTK